MRLSLVLLSAAAGNALVLVGPARTTNRLGRSTRIVAAEFEALPDSPRDELRVRFNRDAAAGYMSPDQIAAAAERRAQASEAERKPRQTEELLEEIRSLMPQTAPEPPAKVRECRPWAPLSRWEAAKSHLHALFVTRRRTPCL